jgi:ABC-2 type transport system permease protein
MRKTLKICQHEIYMLVRRFSFWFAVLGMPLIGFLVYGGAAFFNQRPAAENEALGSSLKEVEKLFNPELQEIGPQGYVDQSGLIEAFPANFPHEQWIAYSDTTAARKALDAGKINAFYIISPDYPNTGQVKLILNNYNMMATSYHSELESLIDYNLLERNSGLLKAVYQPIKTLDEESLAESSGALKGRNQQVTMILVLGILMVFWSGIMGSASILLNSLTNEKENRVLEILMVSSSSSELLFGKILGLCLIGLFQTCIWMASYSVLLNQSGDTFQLPVNLDLPPAYFTWGVIFFLLGYLLYAALIAGLGALVPNLREASQVSTLMMVPLIVPGFFILPMIDAPNGVLPVVLSLIPFTAPTAMMMRLSMAEVPWWQLALSIFIMIGAAALVVRFVAGIFRSQTILTGNTFSIKRFAFAILGKNK